MHPALSIIVFTTASGAGYGMLVWYGLMSAFYGSPGGRVVALVVLPFALVMVTVGLLASTLHLGRPERAWRALSQWRTSWLSREGICSIATYAPAGLLTLAWIVSPPAGFVAAALGLMMVCASLATIYCTAMIYASLKTVHQWCNPYVVPNYLALGLYSGALFLAAALQLVGRGLMSVDLIVVVVGLAALAGKLSYWHFIATTRHPSSPESATGLGQFGKVSLFEAPHTEESFVMREMGFTIARKHAKELRMLSLLALFGAPLILMPLAALIGGVYAAVTMVLAVLLATFGVLVERWLFFAEARHVVTLFYGARVA